MKIPALLRVLFAWLADRLESGDRLQRPLRPPKEDTFLSFFNSSPTLRRRMAGLDGGLP